VNASPDLYADLKIDTEKFEVVALDGMPVAFHDPKRLPEPVDHIFIPPAGRAEAIVAGPNADAHASLRTLCIDTGLDGDPNPAMVLADLVNLPKPSAGTKPRPGNVEAPIYKIISRAHIVKIENRSPEFVVTFTEDKNGFYINGKKFGMSDPPIVTIATGAYHHWRIVNSTNEIHPFHIHQVHFLFYSQNGHRVVQPEWLDTVNVPNKGSVDLIMDFTDPIIRGVSLLHCHLLNHEDKGIMAKVRFK
jgi:FtsP/CotA-like multicopper oxidase with cupredoxin domain